MDIRRRGLWVTTAFVGVLLSAWVFAGDVPALAVGPKDDLKESIEQVLAVLRNPAYKGEKNQKIRREKLRAAIQPRFDFAEMAKRSLARYWKKRTQAERKEFVSIFTDLLERSYVDKIESYTDEKIVYPSERIEDSRYADVKTKIVTSTGRDIPIDYRLFKTQTGWRVYDVVIEGVSLVSNYRGQFKRIIRKESYAELVKRLKRKQEDIRNNSGSDSKL
jgi:phospholipid transport system substrate-binding protein